MNSSDQPGTRVATVCSQFETALHLGRRPSIDRFLEQVDPSERRTALRELVSIEIAFRVSHGGIPVAQEYIARYPELEAAWIRQLCSPRTLDGSGPLELSVPQATVTQDIPAEEFARRLGELGILSPSKCEAVLEQIRSRRSPPTVAKVAKTLEDRRLLTRYQSEVLQSERDGPVLLGEYLVLDRLGEGGMGIVYKALHRRMDRIVALKVLHPEVAAEPTKLQRFEREVRIAASLKHPNIVTAYDAGEDHGVHYFICEFIEGLDLAQLVYREGPLPFSVAVDFTIQTARGLAYAHDRKIIHRDIKPSNLLLDHDNVIKILDMGLARSTEEVTRSFGGITQDGTVVGTVDFMAPEQAKDSKLTSQRSDLYSLGCTLFTLLTGRPMYTGATVIEVLLAHAQDLIPRLSAAAPDVPRAFDAVFERLVAKNPKERFTSAAEVAAQLEAHLGTRERQALTFVSLPDFSPEEPTRSHVRPQVPAGRPDTRDTATQSTAGRPSLSRTKERIAPRPTRRKPARRNYGLLAAVGLLVSIAVTAGAIWFFSDNSSTPSEDHGSSAQRAAGETTAPIEDHFVLSIADEFDDPFALVETSWHVLDRVPPGCYGEDNWLIDYVNTDLSEAGYLTVWPTESNWCDQALGAFIYREVTGDFVAETHVRVTHRLFPGEPPTRNDQIAGLLARDPNSQETTENWVGVQLGNIWTTFPGTACQLACTVNSSSESQLYPTDSTEGIVRLCRVGNDVFAYWRSDPQIEWVPLTFANGETRLHRPDLPATLQVGLACGSGPGPTDPATDPYSGANDQGSGIIRKIPLGSGRPEIQAEFDYFHLAVPRSVEDLTQPFERNPDELVPDVNPGFVPERGIDPAGHDPFIPGLAPGDLFREAPDAGDNPPRSDREESELKDVP